MAELGAAGRAYVLPAAKSGLLSRKVIAVHRTLWRAADFLYELDAAQTGTFIE